MDLSTTIAGVRFPTCFMNASGALCVTREELLTLGRSRAGAIVTKSMTVEPRDGNPMPRYYGFPGGSINSMGLPNLGYKAYAALIPELKGLGKPVIASVAGLCEDDFPMIAAIINAAKPDLIEVNLSCPNIPGKPQIGYDAEASERLLKRVRKVITVPMGVKLPPYFDPAHHAVMGEVIGRCGVDFLNLINSVGNGLVVDPEREAVVIKPKGGFGGLGGTIIKPVALLRAYIAHRRERELQIIDALRHGDTRAAAIVARVYPVLAKGLVPRAEETVLAHLQKLERDGVARRTEDAWHIITGGSN